MELFDEEENTERAELYELFSSLFVREPTEEELVNMKGLFQMKFVDTPYEIGMDFVHLFGDPEGHLPPYESFYNYPVGEMPKVWGRVTTEVQEAYRSAGIMIDSEVNLVPDHLSVELLFMSYLVERDMIKEQTAFLKNHLVAWVPEYSDEIQHHAKTTFYKEVAALLKEFVLSDYEEFEDWGDR